MYLDVSFLQVVLQPCDFKIYMLGSWVPRSHVVLTDSNRRTIVFKYVNTNVVEIPCFPISSLCGGLIWHSWQSCQVQPLLWIERSYVVGCSSIL
jgi:hypothetical protein